MVPSPAQVLHVVLTGGGCAGKSSTTHAVAAQLRQHGLRALTVDETPTAIIASGVNDIGTLDPKVRQLVQEEMTRLMVAQYDSWHRLGEVLAVADGRPVVVVHDQGELAALAYFTPERTDELLGELGLTPQSAADRYDQVFCFHSAARTGGYEVDSNGARYEDVDFALEIDLRMESAWSAYAAPVVIPWQRTHEAKVSLVTDAILALVATRE